MEFIGADGKAAPRLKDADRGSEEWNEERWTELYLQVVRIVRTLYQRCRLVHGDLSEYNLLYFQGEVYVIDVSQSVECDHPQALEFLKRDLANVNDFFGKHGVPVLPVKAWFDFVLEPAVFGRDEGPWHRQLPADAEAKLQRMIREAEDLRDLPAADDDLAQQENEEQVREAVFMNTYTPSCLNEVGEYKKMCEELGKFNRGEPSVCDQFLAAPDEGDSDDEMDGAEPAVDETEENDAGSSGSDLVKVPDGHKSDEMSKAEWKAKVKAENRERRENKMSKAEKKKRTKKR
jgi:RIO kinase 1